MSIVNQKPLSGQFRFRYQAGVPVYEQIIPTADKANNYQCVSRLVVESAWAEFYRRPNSMGGYEHEPHGIYSQKHQIPTFSRRLPRGCSAAWG